MIKDLSGLYFGNYKVIGHKKRIGNKHWWSCQCVCGKTRVLRSDNLKTIKDKNCKCDRVSHRTPNLIGKKFNRLQVIEKGPLSKNKSRQWKCFCNCGNISYVTTYNLKKGTIKSCGCLLKEKARIHIKKIQHLGTLKNIKSIEESGLTKVFCSYRSGAKNRGIDFKLTKKDIEPIIKSNCYYCGIEASNIHKNEYSKKEYRYSGIDRLDNTKGYLVDNVVPCCIICNKAKRDLDLNDFLNWIERLKNVSSCK